MNGKIVVASHPAEQRPLGNRDRLHARKRAQAVHHFIPGSGRLGELHGRCLEFAPGARPRLLIGGDALWSLDDEDEPLLFGAEQAR